VYAIVFVQVHGDWKTRVVMGVFHNFGNPLLSSRKIKIRETLF